MKVQSSLACNPGTLQTTQSNEANLDTKVAAVKGEAFQSLGSMPHSTSQEVTHELKEVKNNLSPAQEILLGPKAEQPSVTNLKALLQAIEKKDLAQMRKLLENHEINLNTSYQYIVGEDHNETGTPLGYCIECLREELRQQDCKNGTDKNISLVANTIKMIELLEEFGADLSAPTFPPRHINSYNALHNVIFCMCEFPVEQDKLIKYLASKKLDINPSPDDKWPPILELYYFGDESKRTTMAKLLLELGATFNTPNEQEWIRSQGLQKYIDEARQLIHIEKTIKLAIDKRLAPAS